VVRRPPAAGFPPRRPPSGDDDDLGAETIALMVHSGVGNQLNGASRQAGRPAPNYSHSLDAVGQVCGDEGEPGAAALALHLHLSAILGRVPATARLCLRHK